MDCIIDIVMGMSISSAFLILVILFLRKAFFGKIPKKVQCALWIIPTVKLLLPFGSVACVKASEVTYAGVCTQTVCEYAESTGLPEWELPLEIPAESGVVWLFGAVFTGGLYIFGHLRLRRELACSLPFTGTDCGLLKAAFGIRRKVAVRVSEFAVSPFTYGIISPVVILPKSAASLPETELKSILCHELSHIKRGDVLFKALLALCAAVHWFDPFVWIMLRAVSRDMELACDETAVMRGGISPDEYALTLIGAAERRFFSRTAGFADGSLRERVTQIMTRGRLKSRVFPAVFAAAFSLAAAVLINFSVVNRAVTSSEWVYETKAAEEHYDNIGQMSVPVVWVYETDELAHTETQLPGTVEISAADNYDNSEQTCIITTWTTETGNTARIETQLWKAVEISDAVYYDEVRKTYTSDSLLAGGAESVGDALYEIAVYPAQDALYEGSAEKADYKIAVCSAENA